MSACCNCRNPVVTRKEGQDPHCRKCGHWYIEPSKETEDAVAEIIQSDAVQKIINHRAMVRAMRFKPRLGSGKIKEP